jgi:3-keto-5-aminohexanoate cleavage enzyme
MTFYKIRFARPPDIPFIISLMEPYNMHHIPSPEMGQLDDKFFLVAESKGKIIGAAGFIFLSSEIGKSTLMAVHPEFIHLGVGKKLQQMRMEILAGFGCNKMITNADRPETIIWYKKHFNYKEIGKIPKLHSFGQKDINEWTTLETNLKKITLKIRQPEKIIINFVPTGNVPKKRDNFNLPTTIKEIVKDVLKATEKGASIVHLHARDSNENPTPDSQVFAEIITRIREKHPDLIICVTTSGRNYSELSKRSAVLDLVNSVKPDMASLTMGSLNFSNQAVSNDPATIMGLANKMLQQDIKPELEVFEIGMIDYTKYLFRKGLLRLPLYTNLFLGSLGTMNASIKNFNFQLRSISPFTYWAATGIGKSQDTVHKMAIRKGGGVRVGLEDNIYLDIKKSHLATNVDLINRVLGHAKTYNREIATPKEVREWLELN